MLTTLQWSHYAKTLSEGDQAGSAIYSMYRSEKVENHKYSDSFKMGKGETKSLDLNLTAYLQ